MQEWHLVHTKAGKEASVRGQLSKWLPEAFLTHAENADTSVGQASRFSRPTVSMLRLCAVIRAVRSSAPQLYAWGT